jgi:hypothetical protein
VKAASRIYFVACAALIGFALLYALPIYAHLAHHYYDPIARRWSWTSTAGPIPMGYYGQMAWGWAGALFAAGVASLVTRVRREPSERAWLLWGAWALTAIVVVIGYFTWNNWP